MVIASKRTLGLIAAILATIALTAAAILTGGFQDVGFAASDRAHVDVRHDNNQIEPTAD